MRPLVVAIGGPSGAGKSTLSRAVESTVLGSITLPQDHFFVPPAACPPDASFCDPRHLDWVAFLSSFVRLAAGEPAVVPEMDFATFEVVGRRTLAPGAVLIVEGMTALRHGRILARADFSYLVHPPMDVIRARKLERDVRDRGKTVFEIERQLTWIRAELEHDLQELAPGGRLDRAGVAVLPGAELERACERILTDIQHARDAVDGAAGAP